MHTDKKYTDRQIKTDKRRQTNTYKCIQKTNADRQVQTDKYTHPRLLFQKKTTKNCIPVDGEQEMSSSTERPSTVWPSSSVWREEEEDWWRG